MMGSYTCQLNDCQSEAAAHLVWYKSIAVFVARQIDVLYHSDQKPYCVLELALQPAGIRAGLLWAN
jgi:hypothetical protein